MLHQHKLTLIPGDYYDAFKLKVWFRYKKLRFVTYPIKSGLSLGHDLKRYVYIELLRIGLMFSWDGR